MSFIWKWYMFYVFQFLPFSSFFSLTLRSIPITWLTVNGVYVSQMTTNMLRLSLSQPGPFSLITYHRVCDKSNTPHEEQELLTLLEYLSSPTVFSGVRVARSLVFYVVFCRPHLKILWDLFPIIISEFMRTKLYLFCFILLHDRKCNKTCETLIHLYSIAMT
jgi:hypothetical protein